MLHPRGQDRAVWGSGGRPGLPGVCLWSEGIHSTHPVCRADGSVLTRKWEVFSVRGSQIRATQGAEGTGLLWGQRRRVPFPSGQVWYPEGAGARAGPHPGLWNPLTHCPSRGQ